MKKKLIISISLIILLTATVAYSAGFAKGSYVTMVWGLRLAKEFINDIDFNEKMLADGIFQWENRIGQGCFNITRLK